MPAAKKIAPSNPNTIIALIALVPVLELTKYHAAAIRPAMPRMVSSMPNNLFSMKFIVASIKQHALQVE